MHRRPNTSSHSWTQLKNNIIMPIECIKREIRVHSTQYLRHMDWLLHRSSFIVYILFIFTCIVVVYILFIDSFCALSLSLLRQIFVFVSVLLSFIYMNIFGHHCVDPNVGFTHMSYENGIQIIH